MLVRYSGTAATTLLPPPSGVACSSGTVVRSRIGCVEWPMVVQLVQPGPQGVDVQDMNTRVAVREASAGDGRESEDPAAPSEKAGARVRAASRCSLAPPGGARGAREGRAL